MKAKRVIGIVLVVFVLIFACSIIACAFIPKNFDLNFENPNRIVVWKEGVPESKITIEYTDERFDEILDLYHKGFKSNLLGALFQGKVFSNVIAQDNKYIGFNSSNLVKNDVYYIQLYFDDLQQTNTYNCDISLSNSQRTYNTVVLQVNNSNSLTLTYAYLGNNDQSSSIGYASYASHAELYNYLKDIH